MAEPNRMHQWTRPESGKTYAAVGRGDRPVGISDMDAFIEHVCDLAEQVRNLTEHESELLAECDGNQAIVTQLTRERDRLAARVRELEADGLDLVEAIDDVALPSLSKYKHDAIAVAKKWRDKYERAKNDHGGQTEVK